MGAFDISRVAFDPRKHYASVRLQQGKVVLDEDINAAKRIENEELRRSRVDIIGPYGSPDNGFRIANPINNGGLIDFQILPGIFHLGGLRLEMGAALQGPPPVPETFRLQKDWLNQPSASHSVPALATGEQRFDLVFAEAWQQAVSAVEDDELFEKAVATDTSTRIRNMRRVHLFEDTGFPDCPRSWRRLLETWDADNLGTLSSGHERVPEVQLTVSYGAAGAADDLCSPAIAGGYLGAENQAIRVQLTDSNHLTWGFDNAAPLYRVTASAVGDTITILTDLKDQHHWPLANQVVEIIPWSAILPNGEKVAAVKGHLSKVVQSYDPDAKTLTLLNALPATFGIDWQSRSDRADLETQTPSAYFYMRVWNRGTDFTSDSEINFNPGDDIPLGQTGITVSITGPDRVANDHWVIAARPETPDQVVPWRLETGMPPHGFRRYYAPLAILRWFNDGAGTQVRVIRDCRKTFRPLTDLETCCTYHVGDGFHSHGDFNSIEEAIQNLPAEGGKICVLPGEHVANVSIHQRSQIHISGCGERSIIRPRLDRLAAPIFRISSSDKIKIENLSLVANTGTAIEVIDAQDGEVESREIAIKENWILACVHAIQIHLKEDAGGNNEIYIGYNRIGMLDKPNGRAAIFSIADGVFIERNRIVVVPAPDPQNPDDPRDDTDPPGGFFDPCADPQLFYTLDFPLQLYLKWIFLYVVNIIITKQRPITYQAEGGIQIGGTSERVKILDNVIIGGAGNGITFGHLPEVDVPIDGTQPNSYAYGTRSITNFSDEYLKARVEEEFSNFVYEVVIEGNHIDHMGLSGIGVVAYFLRESIELIISVEDLTVHRNVITRCAHQVPDTPDEMVDEVAYGGITLSDAEEVVISQNRIEDNGNSQVEPVCGVFFLYGDKIDISNNRILNNGPQLSDSDDLERGLRGGIVIKTSFKEIFTRIFEGIETLSPDGVPAVKVHDNIVAQPAGQALYIIALGPVSVIGNQFTAQGADFRVNPISLLAGTVFIFNLGLAQELFWLLAATSLKGMTKLNMAGYANNSGVNNQAAMAPVDENALNKLLYWPSGEVLFSNNQTTLDLRHPDLNIALSSQLIVSLDDVAYNSNQSQCISLIDLVLTNTAIIAFSVRTNDNRFEDGQFLDLLRNNNSTLFSLISIGIMNTAIGNLSTHCLLVLGSNTPPSSLLEDSNRVLISQDCVDRKGFLESGLGVKKYNTKR